MLSRTSNWKWKGVAVGLALFPVMSSLEARLAAAPPAISAMAEPSGKEAEAKNICQKAREALKAGDLAKAESLAKQAQGMKVDWAFWDKDRPDALLSEIATAQAKTSTADPKTLLKQAREALAANKFDEAQAYASRAGASKTNWGVFGDSPTKCMDEINKARSKSDKVESVKLLAEARKMFKENKLDDAESLAIRAERLHGPYGVMEMGDKPQKLLSEIQTVKGKQKKSDSPLTPGVAMNETKAKSKDTPAPSWDDVKPAVAKSDGKPAIQPASATVTDNPNKAQAQRLMVSGKMAMKNGRMIEARKCFLEAQKVCSDFKPDEENPVRCMNELMTTVSRQVTDTTKEAATATDKTTAEAKLKMARALAVEFGLDVKALDSQMAKSKNTGPAVASTSAAGQSLLDKARVEMQRGQIEIARQIATEAHNGPYDVKSEAMAVLRSIDAEEASLKSQGAMKSYEAAVSAFQSRDFVHAMAIFRQIETELLPIEQQVRMTELLTECVQKTNALASIPAKEVLNPPSVVPATMQSTEVPSLPTPPPAPTEPVLSSPPSPMPAHIAQPSAPPAANLAEQVKAMQTIEFQRLRDEGLKVQTESKKLFERGETDAALEMLQSYLNTVKATKLEPSSVTLLCRPVEQRLQSLTVAKSQKDSQTRITGRKTKHDQEMGQAALAEDRKQELIKELFKQYNRLKSEGKLQEAQLVTAKLKQLAPDQPEIVAIAGHADANSAAGDYAAIKANNEKMFRKGLNDAEDSGPYVNSDNPVHINGPTLKIAKERGEGVDAIMRTQTDAEKEIKHRMSTVVDSLSFSNAPLRQVIDDIKLMTGINIVADDPALEEDRISLDTPVSIKLDKIKLESGLNVILQNLKLTYVIRDDVLKITTTRKARGQVVQKVYRVADLVMPIEDYVQPHAMNLERAINRVIEQQQMNTLGRGGATPFNNGRFMLPDGQPASGGPAMTTSPTAQMTTQPTLSQTGAQMTQKQTMHEMLIKLIQNTINPGSWADVGGAGTIDYMPIGMALVINQTPDVQEQVFELLQALRRLQDLQVSLEIRLISLSETFFERIGLDFNLNIKTDKNTERFESQLVTNQFKPAGFVNDFSPNRFVAGVNPAGGQFPNTGSFTSDLDIPIRTSSFQYSIPPFAYPNNPGFDGGISMGLAFLSDIQVYMFMEAAQGDRRMHVMQAPKLTLTNGQTASISVQDQQFFVTNVGIVGFGGQIVFVPQNNPFPLGVEITLQAVVSADRRFVRVNTNIRMANLASALVPLFPVTTFITPVFEGGAQGQPIPFTQFIQQPALALVNIQTTVSIPDGGTVILGGLKSLSEGRNEFGPPVLSKVPYVNRLFKNVGFGREAQSLLIMVTPRIIINAEEEERQTGETSREQ